MADFYADGRIIWSDGWVEDVKKLRIFPAEELKLAMETEDDIGDYGFIAHDNESRGYFQNISIRAYDEDAALKYAIQHVVRDLERLEQGVETAVVTKRTGAQSVIFCKHRGGVKRIEIKRTR